MPARTARGAPRATIARTTAADGLMLAPIRGGGRWAALRALHEGMHHLRDQGLQPTLSFVMAIAEDGRIVPGRDPATALFILGYRTT